VTRAHRSQEQELAERVVDAMLSRDAFSAWLGITLLEVAPRTATVQMTVRPEMINGFGVCHGGVAFAVADSALGFASNTHGRVTVAIENSITYPAPIRVGDVLTAVAEEESATSNLAFYRVVVRKQDDSVASLFRGTVYRTKQEFFPEQISDG
jgi:acyl-CoA thioesterase